MSNAAECLRAVFWGGLILILIAAFLDKVVRLIVYLADKVETFMDKKEDF